MRAAVVTRYGDPDVVELAELPDPTPGKGRLLVRVVATAVTAGDARIRGARFPRGFGVLGRVALGLRRPRRPVLGGVYSGVVEQVGPGVTGVAVGDLVCGMTGASMGAHADLLVCRADRAVVKPDGITHEQAAGVLFGGSTALHYLRTLGEVRDGQRVLVNGASGAVGSVAVQLARHLGAEVTAVTSAANAELARSLGATHVVDYAVTPVGSLGERYDVVLDAVGNIDIAGGRRLLADGGRLLLAVGSLSDTIRARGAVRAGPAPERAEHFAELVGLVAAGELTVVMDPQLDPATGLAGVVDAHRRVDSGRKVGNLVLRLRDSR